LAEKLRPVTLAEFVGQPHLTGEDSLLMNSLANGSSGSYIFWGPPGYSSHLMFADSITITEHPVSQVWKDHLGQTGGQANRRDFQGV
jgi:hypothetical protein